MEIILTILLLLSIAGNVVLALIARNLEKDVHVALEETNRAREIFEEHTARAEQELKDALANLEMVLKEKR